MKKPVLVIMAAGIGSRYGGCKQMDPVGSHDQVILDYSIYDARRAGFETVIFVIKDEIEADFKERIGGRIERHMDVHYAFQRMDDLPEGYCVPAGRTKPWGTAQAALAARPFIGGPFAIINADDYYGPDAFRVMYDYLCAHSDGDEYAMVAYRLENTVTDYGFVARGVCEVGEDGRLTAIAERTRIEKGPPPRFTEDGGTTWTELSGDTMVSMNFWVSQMQQLASIRDVTLVGQQAAIPLIINMAVGLFHSFMYNPATDGPRAFYDARTRKILMLSNIMASGTNLALTAGTENWLKLDVGGLLVTATRAMQDLSYLTALEDEFIRHNMDKALEETLQDVDSHFLNLPAVIK